MSKALDTKDTKQQEILSHGAFKRHRPEGIQTFRINGEVFFQEDCFTLYQS